MEGDSCQTLRQLEYLVAIDETRHFHRAAHKVGVAQPTLSAQVKALEDRLGVLLVERNRTSVVITETGQQVVTLARRILMDVKEIRDIAETSAHDFSGTIRFGVSPTIGPYLLPHVIPGLHKAHKTLKLYVRESIPAHLPGDLLDGKYDLILTTTPVNKSGVVTLPLFREPLYIAVPSDWALAKSEKIEKNSLKGQSLLALEIGHQLHEQVETICQEFGARLMFDYEGTSLDTIRQMVGMGMGLSILPGLYVKSELRKDKSVVVRELKGRALYRTIGLAWRVNSIRSYEFEVLASHIITAIKKKFPHFTVL